MSERLDVLGDLRTVSSLYDIDLSQSIAAVVELAAAANIAADWITEAGLRHRDMPNSATLARLTTALAPFGLAS